MGGDYLTPLYGNVPQEMQGFAHWVMWCTVPATPKPRKIALNPGRGYAASTKKPETWGAFDQAVAFCKNRLGQEHRFRLQGENVTGIIRGIGFELSEAAPFVGVDLDNCVDSNGMVAPWALDIIDRLQSYTEFSPSGTGIRIFVRAEKAGNRCRKDGVEIYRKERFLTVTGHLYPKAGCNS